MRFATLAVCVLLLTAGCTDTTGSDVPDHAAQTDAPTPTPHPSPTLTPTPTSSPTPTPTPSPTPVPTLNESGFRDAYVDQLAVNDVDVDDASYRRGTLVLKYRTHATNRTAMSNEFYRIADWYPRLLEHYDGYEPDAVRLWIKTPGGDKIAHYTIKRELAKRAIEGDVDRNEYYEKILETGGR